MNGVVYCQEFDYIMCELYKKLFSDYIFPHKSINCLNELNYVNCVDLLLASVELNVVVMTLKVLYFNNLFINC